MKKELQTALIKSIKHYLSFSEHEIPMPNAYVLDKRNTSVSRIVLEFGITDDDMAICDASILANEGVFEKTEYDATLCHELGHYIIYCTRPHRPTDRWKYLLTNEVAADREGLKLFVRSGKRRMAYLILFFENFPSLLNNICRTKSYQKLWLYSKAMANNFLRITAFTYYSIKCS